MKIPVERRSINSLKRAVDWLISAAREMISRYDLSKPSVAPTHTRVAGLEAAETAASGDIPDLLKRLRALGTHTLKEDWKKGKRCPECGVSSERPNCAIDAGGYCQAHDQRYYKLSSDDYVFKADGHAQAAAALIEKQQGEIKRLRKALEEIARQKLHAEITDSDPDELDWLGGYEVCVKRARSAIAETAP